MAVFMLLLEFAYNQARTVGFYSVWVKVLGTVRFTEQGKDPIEAADCFIDQTDTDLYFPGTNTAMTT